MWTLGTTDVALAGNVSAGGLVRQVTGCPAPPIVPTVVGIADGLPPAPWLSTPLPGELASSGLVIDRNTAQAGQSTYYGAAGARSVALQLNEPFSNLGPLVQNNILIAYNGAELIAFEQTGGDGARVINNTLAIHYEGLSAGTVAWGVHLEDIAPDGVVLINNLIAILHNPAHPTAQSVPFVERNASGLSSDVGAFDNNLLYVENRFPGPAYVRLTDGAATPVVTEFSSTELNAIAGVSDISGNFAALPVLGPPGYRPRIGSPVVDAGLPAQPAGPAPAYDIDGDARPNGAGVDVGADEL
jgi:hypothetical protein